jgi:hypothetical protein
MKRGQIRCSAPIRCRNAQHGVQAGADDVLSELTCRTVAVLDLLKTAEEHGSRPLWGDRPVMNRSGVRERPGRPAHRPGGPVFDLVVSKLRRPVVRRGTVPRWSLIDRLSGDELRSIVSVVAPAGYGKTMLLAQWAERTRQAVAWVSVDDGDNDPKVLLTYVAEALDGVQPIGGRVFDALGSPTSSVPGSVVPRLGGGVRGDDRAGGVDHR